MKRFLMCVVAVAVALVLAQSAQAQPPGTKNKTQGVTQPGLNALQDVFVNNQKVGTLHLLPNGRLNVTTLSTGHQVSLQMKNGVPTGAFAVNRLGNSLPATTQVRTEASRRIIVIVIRSGGTTIIIVIRQRAV